MKPEEQNKDQLDRFFKQHLENHPSLPSEDFWDRMEEAIPEKPSVWAQWKDGIHKFRFLILLVFVFIGISLFTIRAKVEKENLLLLTEEQQRRIEQIKQQNNLLQKQLKEFEPIIIDSTSLSRIEMRSKAARNFNRNMDKTLIENEDSSQKNIDETLAEVTVKEIFEKTSVWLNGNRPLTEQQQNSLQNELDTKAASKVMARDSNLAKTEGFTNSAKATPISLDENDEHFGKGQQAQEIKTQEEIALLLQSNAVALLPVIESTVITQNEIKNARAQIAQIKGNFQPTSRISFEASSFVLMQPLSASHIQSIGGPGQHKNIPALGQSLLMNFQLGNKWALQSGFQVKNMKSDVLTRTYNSFPLNIKRRIAVWNRSVIELKMGLDLNLLVQAKTTEGSIVSGVETSNLGYNAGVVLAIPLNKKFNLVLEPFAGTTINEAFAGDRLASYGFNFGIRYKNN